MFGVPVPRARRLAVALIALSALATMAPAVAHAQTGTVSGRITEGGGAPISGARVQATMLPGRAAAGGSNTGEDGRFRLTLAPGTYLIQAARIGYLPGRADTVRVRDGGAETVNATLANAPSTLDQVVTTASRAPEKILEAPASISVVTAQQIERRPAMTAVDHLRATPGIDVSQGGLVQSNVVARGFNNAFSGSMLMLQDYRFAGVPSLRVNVPFLFTGSNEDIERIEVLLGPASALYGPNSANGVLHIITKSPFASKGTMLTVDGGSRSLVRASARHAAVLSDKVAVKVSGEYFTGKDFEFNDPAEPATFPSTSPAGRRGQPNPRNFDVNRVTGEGRLDYRPAASTEAITTFGFTRIGSGIELTGANGASQVKGWKYMNLQQRFRHKNLFLQAFVNASDAGNADSSDTRGTYLLRTGAPIVDKSRVFAAQGQHALNLGGDRQRFVYGLDYIFTNPRTGNTINGQNEDVDNVVETGAYVQSTTKVTPKLDLLGALRVDKHNKIDGTQFSPRAALVFKPTENHSLRATYNRAFSTPANFSFFLDLGQAVNAGGSGFNIRARGNPPQEGWQYNRSCNAAVNGGLCMRSRYAGGGQFVDASAAAALPALLAAQAAGVQASLTGAYQQAGFPAAQAAAAAQATVANITALRPTSAQIGSRLAFLTSGTVNVSPAALQDIQPLKASFNTTYELGYKGILANRARLAVDLWQQRRGDVGTPASLVTPNVWFDAASLAGYLTQTIPAAMVQAGVPQQAAAAIAPTLITSLAQLARLPVGLVTFANGNTNATDILATYQTIGKSIDVRGIDVAFDYQLTPELTLAATYGYQGDTDSTKTVFENVVTPDGRVLMLNAPAHRGTLGLSRQPSGDDGLGFEARTRYNNAFPVNSGVFASGTAFPSPGSTTSTYRYESVRTNFLVDAGVSYGFALSGRRAIVSLNATNLLNKGKAWTFSGTPSIERMIISRLQYKF